MTKEENKSPILLIPIELYRESVHDPFNISIPPIEEEVLFNPALQVKLENDFKIELPPLPEFILKSSLEDYLNSIEESILNRIPRPEANRLAARQAFENVNFACREKVLK